MHLRYHKSRRLKNFTTAIIYILLCAIVGLVFVLLYITGVIDIDSRWHLLGFAFVMLVLVALSSNFIIDKLFLKKVLVEDLDARTFWLIIGQKKFLLNKNDIQEVRRQDLKENKRSLFVRVGAETFYFSQQKDVIAAKDLLGLEDQLNQFRGVFTEKKEGIIVDRVPLRYSPSLFVKFATIGLVYLLLMVVLISIGLTTFLELFDALIERVPALIFIAVGGIFALIAIIGSRVVNFIFNKSVTLQDLDENTFLLTMNEKEYFLNKSEIRKVTLQLNSPNTSMELLTFKVGERPFRFSAMSTDEVVWALTQMEKALSRYRNIDEDLKREIINKIDS